MEKGKKIILTIGETELAFTVSLQDYNDYINAVKPDDKVAPSLNFLRRTVDPEQKELLKSCTDQGLHVELAGLLIQEFRPDVEIAVKK
ncbi:MAG: putative phage tail assembly chaperone [Victivallaceae bacterium]|nr:putative phage tail assembly chaperone [Victivallaceae bacterium]